MFKLLKDSIGKDKVTLPVYVNEPLSLLQRTAEVLENEMALIEANNESDPLVRLMKVSAFCITQYGSLTHRLDKPFNPLLGETYELKCKKFKFIAEQVSHHPPVSASYAESEDYEFYTDVNP